MYIKRISFIEVRSPDSYIFKKFPIPRLGPVLLSTMLAERGYEVRCFIEDVAEPDWSFVENSDIVCISSITSTIHKAYEIADRLRKLGIIVIMGGAHPTFVADETIDHADYVVRGEGDISLLKVIGHLENAKTSLSDINGITYKHSDNTVIHNPPQEYIADLDTLPDPDFSLIHGWRGSHVHPIASSRGCAFNCSFCLVAHMFGRKYRFRSVERVVHELKHINSISSSYMFFVDDNFAANKSRTREILKGMIGEKIRPRWAAMVRPDIAGDAELLDLLAQSGNFTASIGFESVNADTLKIYNKKQTIDDNINSIKILKDYGIRIHGMFVFGADTDTVDTIRRTTDFAAMHGLDSVQFMVLTPLPGTPLFEQYKRENRLLHTDWSKYDIHHVVHKPALITPAELHFETLNAMKDFYSWHYIVNRFFRMDVFYAAFGFYSRGIIHRAIKEANNYIEYLKTKNTL